MAILWGSTRRLEHGQAIIEFTLLLPVIIGFLALIIDGGFAMFQHMECKTIAMSTALAAASAAYNVNASGCGYGIVCGSYTCQSSDSVNSANNLQTGCVYGEMGDSTPNKTASITATGGTSAIAGVSPAYWVDVLVNEPTPMFFSPGMHVSARATAAVWTNGTVTGVYLIR